MSITFNESREITEETFTVDDIIIKFINTTISVVDNDEPVVIYIEPLSASTIKKSIWDADEDEENQYKLYMKLRIVRLNQVLLLDHQLLELLLKNHILLYVRVIFPDTF